MLLGLAVPHIGKQTLILGNDWSGKSCVHIGPTSEFWSAMNIVIRHIQTTRIYYLTIYHYHFAVHTMQGMIDIRKAHRVEANHIYPPGTIMRHKFRSYSSHISTASKSIIQQPHLNAMGTTFGQSLKHLPTNTVVEPLVVFYMDVVLSLGYILFQGFKFSFTAGQHLNIIVFEAWKTIINKILPYA